MAVQESVPLKAYTATGGSAVFAYDFPVLQSGDMKVLVEGVAPVAFVVDGVGDPAGGFVTITPTPTIGQRVVLYRDTELTRDVDYQTNGDLLAAVVNTDFDRLWLALQEMVFGTKASGASVRAQPGEVLSELDDADAREDRLLAFSNPGGDTTLSPFTVTQVASAIAAAYAAGSTADAVSFIQAGIDALARSLQERDREVLKVTDFEGCDPTGATDSADAFDAAVAQAVTLVVASGTRGVKIKVPAGNYRLSRAITIPQDNIIVEGDGRYASTILAENPTDIFDFDKGDGSTIFYSGVFSLGMRALSGANHAAGSYVRMYNPTGCVVYDCHLQGWYVAIELIGAARCYIDRVSLSQAQRTAGVALAGVHISGDATAGISTGNHIVGLEVTSNSSVTGPYEHAILVKGSDGLYIENSHWTDGVNGLTIDPDNTSGNDTVASIIVVGTYFDACEGRNLYLTGTCETTTDYYDLRFAGCILRAGDTALVSIGSTSALSPIKGVMFSACSFRQSRQVAVTFANDNARGVTFDTCTWQENNLDADASGHDLVIRGENVTVSNSLFLEGNATGNCVFIASTAQKPRVIDNDMSASGRTTKIANNATAGKGFLISGNQEGGSGSVIESRPTATTTDATPTVIWSYPLASDEAIALDVDVFGMSSGISSGTHVRKIAAYYKDGAAAPALIGSQTTVHEVETAAGYAVAIQVTSNTIEVAVTGLAASTITWLATIRATLRGV